MKACHLILQLPRHTCFQGEGNSYTKPRVCLVSLWFTNSQIQTTDIMKKEDNKNVQIISEYVCFSGLAFGVSSTSRAHTTFIKILE